MRAYVASTWRAVLLFPVRRGQLAFRSLMYGVLCEFSGMLARPRESVRGVEQETRAAHGIVKMHLLNAGVLNF